ncbi:histidinol-phosphate transaminase [Pollutimonas bauzanensis]|uniref:Histidinol-phosphate aminotransferase n=1 Tax=Pollutimonas bauzanensis TaxID=658167 RepID=A0A1M5M9X9_9BURK|nr:histidinol-phosphate transaminase [Pollutimonas bauzanensis]SHG74080.1 histidinol-phosphate aminotransferase [Pollutimonas bauzanensis]
MNEYSETVQSLLRPEIHGLPAYDPGADSETVSREFKPPRVIKLSNNENPYGLSPVAAQAIQRRLDQGMGRYPDPAGKELCRVLAERHGVEHRRVVLGNGSENILELLCQAFLGKGETVVAQTPCFGLHEIFPLMMGAGVHKVPLTETFGFDASRWRQALEGPVKLVFVCQPSNPVGTVFSREELQALIAYTSENALLVVDEAYYEYARLDPAYADALDLLRHVNRPWIVLRTFSKAYGLAGLRVGYAIASHANLIEALHRVRTPYNVNQLAQEAALAALDDVAHLEKSVSLISQERARLTQALRVAGFRVAPSHTNFLFIDTGMDAIYVMRQLLRAGVIVKAWREPGYDTYIRVSLALPADNDVFLQELIRVQNRV